MVVLVIREFQPAAGMTQLYALWECINLWP